MLLVMDVGNTNTSLGVFEGERLAWHWRLTTEKARTTDEYGVHARNLFAFAGLDFKVIEEGGRYLGGVITPGISISTDALFARAARLPRVGIERPHRVIGASTVAAIQSGLYYGYAGLVDGILRRMIEELGRRPRVVATGGLAPLIATASEFIDEVDQTLTLDGLRLVYERNRGASHGDS